jgi:hypothetical protein
MVIVVDLRLDLRLDSRLCHFSFGHADFPCLSMDGHPQATVVHFPCSLSQRFKEATMGITLFLGFITSRLFSCSTVYSKRGSIA